MIKARQTTITITITDDVRHARDAYLLWRERLVIALDADTGEAPLRRAYRRHDVALERLRRALARDVSRDAALDFAMGA